MLTNGPAGSIVLYGAGGHAKTAIAVLEAEGKWRLAGLLEDGEPPAGKRVLGYPVLGNRSRLPGLRDSGTDKALVAIGDNAGRGRIAADLRDAGFTLICIVHPLACIMKDAQIGEGSLVHAHTVIGPECRIGENAIVSALTCVGHESEVGRCAQFTPGVRIGGRVRIGDFAFLGMGAVVFPGITIGNNVRIGANAVVNKDLGDNVVAVGAPARVVKRIEEPC